MFGVVNLMPAITDSVALFTRSIRCVTSTLTAAIPVEFRPSLPTLQAYTMAHGLFSTPAAMARGWVSLKARCRMLTSPCSAECFPQPALTVAYHVQQKYLSAVCAHICAQTSKASDGFKMCACQSQLTTAPMCDFLQA